MMCRFVLVLKVALKTGYVSDIYTVMNIDDDEVQCDRRETHEQKTFRLDELVTVGRIWRGNLSDIKANRHC